MNGSPDQTQSVAVTCPGCFHPRTWEAAAACPICHHRVHAQGRSSTLLPVGTQLKNYIVGEKLGQGGFGITYRGFDLNLHMKVAIKEYYPSEWVGRSTDQKTVVLNASEHEELFQYCRKTFLREAQTIAQVRHPHVVRVLSYFELNGTAYLVMDYYEGQDLSRFLKPAAGQPGTKMPWRQAVTLLLPVLDGLHKVHQIGFMHRDIKPGNLYLSEDGLILLDFGSARQVVSSHTQSKLIFTEGYAPYEQYSEGQLDRQGPWTDVYAVAATLYFMLTARRPSSALDRIQAALMQKPDSLKPARQFVADVPPGLDQALCWALAVEPERRPQSVVEFKRELESLLVAHPEPKPQPLPVKADIAPELPTRSVTEGRISPSRAAKAEPEIESNRASEPPPAPHPTTPALRATPPSTSSGSLGPGRRKSRSVNGIAVVVIIAFIGLLAWGGWSIGLKPALERRSAESPTTPPVAETPPMVATSSPPVSPTLRLDRSYLTVVTTPATAQVRIMNISPPYQHGIELMPGDFDIQVTAPDYQTYRGWHTLAAGVINLPIELQKKGGWHTLAVGVINFIGLQKNEALPVAPLPTEPAPRPVVVKQPEPARPTQRFTDNDDGTVTDNQTGLIWLKDANCFGEQNWSTAMSSARSLANRACGLRDGSVAGQWRLPLKEEWEDLIDKEARDPALPSSHPFKGVQSSNYWSSTTFVPNTGGAWHVYLYDGFVGAFGKTFTYYVWPVRDRR